MLYDIRTYTTRPGALKKQLQLYHDFGLAPQSRHLGAPFAFLQTDTGNINSYTHIWVYQNAGDREEKRKTLMNDPDWQDYSAKVAECGYLLNQETCLMKDVWFME